MKCCGTAFYLKSQYDVGYSLNISLTKAADQNIANALLSDIKDKLQNEEARLLGYVSTEIIFRISFDCNANLPILFRYMDNNKESLNISKYTISATTLEEVFRMINHSAVHSSIEESVSKSNDPSISLDGKYKPPTGSRNNNNNTNSPNDNEDSKLSVHSDTGTARNSLMSIDTNPLGYHQKIGTNDIDLLDMSDDKVFEAVYATNYIKIHEYSTFLICCTSFFWNHVFIIFWKRFKNAQRDAKTFCCQCFIPTL